MTFDQLMADCRRALKRAMTCTKHGTVHARGPQSEFFLCLVELRDFVTSDDDEIADIASATAAISRYVRDEYRLGHVEEAKIRSDLCCPDMRLMPKPWMTKLGGT